MTDSLVNLSIAIEDLKREQMSFIAKHRFNESVPDGSFFDMTDFYIKSVGQLEKTFQEIKRKQEWFRLTFEDKQSVEIES